MNFCCHRFSINYYIKPSVIINNLIAPILYNEYWYYLLTFITIGIKDLQKFGIYELLEVFLMPKFNIVNVYKHKSYFSRLISVEPAQALRLHALLMEKMNNVSQNRNQNKIKATPVDDAAALGISKATYQKYKKALLDAKIWTYDDKFKNNHRIAGDWHLSEDLLDDPFALVLSEETRKDADVPSDEKDSDDKNKSLVLREKTRKDENDGSVVSSEETKKMLINQVKTLI